MTAPPGKPTDEPTGGVFAPPTVSRAGAGTAVSSWMPNVGGSCCEVRNGTVLGTQQPGENIVLKAIAIDDGGLAEQVTTTMTTTTTTTTVKRFTVGSLPSLQTEGTKTHFSATLLHYYVLFFGPRVSRDPGFVLVKVIP